MQALNTVECATVKSDILLFKALTIFNL